MVNIDSYVEVAMNDEKALLQAVAKQPVSVGIDASQRDFQFYAGVTFLLNSTPKFFFKQNPTMIMDYELQLPT